MGEMREICMIRSLFVEFSADGQQSEGIEAKVDEFSSKLHKICMIHCKFKLKKKFGIFTCSFRRQGIKKCVRPELCFVWPMDWDFFAVRLPSLSRRMECGDSGITFDIFFFFFCSWKLKSFYSSSSWSYSSMLQVALNKLPYIIQVS